MSTEVVNVDELTSFGDRPPTGIFTGHLLSAEGKESKKGNPMVVGTFMLDDGDAAGLDTAIFYSLKVTEKNGRKYCGGISDMKRMFAFCGVPLPAGYQFPLSAPHAAALLAKTMRGKKVRIKIVQEQDKEDSEKSYTRATIIGPAEVTTAVAGVADAGEYGE